jgi:preprotein translocase subunit SecY
MNKIISTLTDIWDNDILRKKIIFTFGMLLLYRLLVFVPVPFVDIDQLMNKTLISWGWLDFFAMLLGWSLDNFSIIAVWLAPYINASIITQLLTSVIPHLEELQEQWEAGTAKIAQYTRRLSFPLAFLQSIGMVYFINYLLWWGVINTSSMSIVLLCSLALTFGSVLLLYISDLITEKWISNGTSLIIFASIVSGIVSKVFVDISSAGDNIIAIVLFMLAIVLVLIILSVFILKTKKEIPIVYAKQGKIEQSASLPLPLNPVGMVPIIFAIAFASFPYLISQIIIKFGNAWESMVNVAKRIEINFNIYNQDPGMIAIVAYFILIIAFTFFYSLIVFSPEKMADNIQKRWWFIPGIRPGTETANYIQNVLYHLCLRWGIGLWLVGVYSYVLNYIPFIQQISQSLGSVPVVVQWSGVIIIVWVVQEIIGKVQSELLIKKYD